MPDLNPISKKAKHIIPPADSHPINTEHAKKMMQDFKDMMSKNGSFDSKNIGGTFNRDIFDSILNQPGCTGIRYYFGIDKENHFDDAEDVINYDKLTIIVLGVDSDGEVMLNGSVKTLSQIEDAEAKDALGDKSWPTSRAPF